MEELLEKFKEIHNVTIEVENNMQNGKNINAYIINKQGNIKIAKEIAIGLTIGVCLLLLLGSEIFWFVAVLVTLIWISIYLPSRIINMSKIKKAQKDLETNNNYINYLINRNRDVLSFIPSEYWYTRATYYLYKLVEDGRVSTRNEALNMLDMQIHRWRMESASAQMLAQYQAQTQYLSRISSNSSISAVADVASAVTLMTRL